MNFIVSVTDRNVAKPFVIKHHYSKAFGKASLILGLYEVHNPTLLGVITFGQVSGRLLAQSIFEGGTQSNTFEFLRMCVLDDCKCPRTYFMSQAISILRQKFPQIKCLVSFADQTEGHIGTVYQAGSWLYVGKTNKKYHYIDMLGKRINKRIPWDKAKSIGISEKEYVTWMNWTKVTEEPKLRYIMPLKKLPLKQSVLKYIKSAKD